LLLSGCLASTALAVDFVRDGTIILDAAQITNTSDGFVPGKSWEGFLAFPAPVTVAASDTLRGTVSFGADLLRIRDNGGGFFQVGAVKGFEQLIATADDAGPSRISQTNSAVRFTDVRGAALQTGGARVGGINDDGLFIQVVVDMVPPGQEFFASGSTYRLGFVSGGGPFTFDGISVRVLAEELGIEPRPVGDVAYRGCITGETESGPGGTDACAQIGSATAGGDDSGLNNLRSVMESPDGKSLYVVAGFDDAVARFDRDLATGGLTYQGCITGETQSGPTGTNACTQIASATPAGENSGLDLLQSVAVSADGASVYTASIGDDAVARFDRDPATGALTYQDCITGEDLSNDTACSKVGSATTTGADSGLDGLRSVVVSADGKSLYAVSPEDDAVARFDRDPATGALTYQGCITGETESGPTGSNACAQIGSATSLGANSGLDSVFALAVSADGNSVYTVSLFDDAVARFDRDPATGALTYQGCITGETESGPAGSGACAQIGSATSFGTSSGLDSVFAVAVSADGASLYAVSEDDDAVARFDRNLTGALVYQGCISGETQSGPTGTDACVAIDSATSGGTNSGLDKLRSVTVSADGLSVYAASPADDTVARFDRDPATGALGYQGCLTAEAETGVTGTKACGQIGSAAAFGASSGLDNPQSLAVSADGLSLYTASGNDAAVARFDREPEPPPTTTTTSTTTTTTTTSTTTTTTTTTSPTTSITTTTSTTSTTATTATTVATTTTTTSTTTTSGPTTTQGTTTTTTTTTGTAPTTTTTSTTTTTAPTSTTTTTQPGGCEGLPGLEGIECQLTALVDLLAATSEEDLGGVKDALEQKAGKALRLIKRAQTATGRLAITNPRRARVLLKTFIGILERRVERGRIAGPLADALIELADTLRAQLVPFTKR
jgi:6-phosphogluconolactonase (cycloisomerase 2 family)